MLRRASLAALRLRSATTSICASAARGGHLQVLQWAHTNSCEWDWQTCANAALGKVLKWARENGCPCDEKNMCTGCSRRSFAGATMGTCKRMHAHARMPLREVICIC